MTEYVRFHCPQCADPSPIFENTEGWIDFTKEYHEILSGHSRREISIEMMTEEDYNMQEGNPDE